MLILGIESSCDETAASVSLDGRRILSNVVYSQIDMHALYGGVVPEIASRKHAEKITAVVREAVRQAGIEFSDLDAVAATCAPGLIGALLVGANFAKACSLMLEKPFVPVHHIRGHIAANYVAFPQLEPPFTALVTSGGHSLIVDVKDYTEMEVLGTTRDDAAGEAFDKIARVMSLPYPGGAALDRLSQGGDKDKYRLPRAVVAGHPFDLSFSGLKTAALNIMHHAGQKGEEIDRPALAAAVANAVADSVVPRVIDGAKLRGRQKIAAAGGVAANSTLRAKLKAACEKNGIELYLPPLDLCGDNGAMIACQAYYEFMAGNISDSSQNCYANMSVSERLCER